jgi:predicted DNA-binding transcriptional regulator YafY
MGEEMASTKRGTRREERGSLIRLWKLVLALQERRKYGASVRVLMEELGVARQTIYKYLKTLEEAGVPLVSSKVAGEARYRLLTEAELPDRGLSPLQIAALHLARAELAPLAGTRLLSELDHFLAKLKPPEAQQHFHFADPAPSHPDVLEVLDQAIREKRRVTIDYRAASRGGRPTSVQIEPLLLRVADREPYVRAYCVERDAERTYKLARVTRATLSRERSTYSAPEGTFAGSVKAWSGDLQRVRVRLARDVAWLAREYPLIAEQRTEAQEDGTVVVEALVAGIQETLRWVLSWGGSAEALEPKALRDAVRKELLRALGPYEGPGPVKVKPKRKIELSPRVMTGGE